MSHYYLDVYFQRILIWPHELVHILFIVKFPDLTVESVVEPGNYWADNKKRNSTVI